MKETTKPTIRPKVTKETPKRSCNSYKYLDMYPDLFQMKNVPISPLFFERIGAELIKWAQESKAIKISSFFLDKGITRGTYEYWLQQYPLFKDFYLHAKEIIGVRREELAFHRKADAGVFLKSAAQFDPEWKRTEEWRSAMNKEEKAEGVKLIVEKITAIE